ncbi:related to heterokaryon incompatibility protein [Rhynchosporium secalis]|uniref:Related to heterokaryon incompatibility protein n=1 Tax=Rhynchosporium secalis TaxID=38038 RepID=A0A1E1LXN7_RHYSE|nr:related to heterokaryon incompatibility protein [Rhynchosporium secalis]
MSSNIYKYTPLDEKRREIRLLVHLPGALDDPIQVLIQVPPFTDNDTPNYEALSYAWGSTEYLQNIRVGNTVSDITTLEITRGLAQALPYLRHRNEPRTLWIDAICVNQQDLQERGSQVK